MNRRAIGRQKFIAWTAMIVLFVAAVGTPFGRQVVVGGLVELGQITDKIVRFPCWLVDHSRCFSLDRFDPTCPQCL